MVKSLEVSKRSTLGVSLVLVLSVLSFANWAERGRFGVPEDGVVWVDAEAGVSASVVAPESPAALVGVRPDDILRSIGGRPISEVLDVPRVLAHLGAWTRAEYLIERAGRSERFSIVIGESLSRGRDRRLPAGSRLGLRRPRLVGLAALPSERGVASFPMPFASPRWSSIR